MSDPRRRIVHNPFYVLGLGPEASRIEVEREGQKLLGMLALGMSAAARYQTPLGPATRTPEAVREAMAELRDPERRLMHELWARVPAEDAAGDRAVAGELGAGAQGAGAAGASAAGAGQDASEAGAAGAAGAARMPWPRARALLGWQRRGRRGAR